jgi:uncharacterized Zn finger protein (UPF0148 family)
MSELNKCAGHGPTNIWGSSKACTRTGKLAHDGKMWCAIHHPPTKRAKRDAKDAERTAARERSNADYDARRKSEAEQARRAECFDDLLAALEMLYAETADYIRLNNLGGMDNQCMQLSRAAIAKATGSTP